MMAQEQQRLESKKQYETQAEFQEYMKRQLEEQSRLQMMVSTKLISTPTLIATTPHYS